MLRLLRSVLQRIRKPLYILDSPPALDSPPNELLLQIATYLAPSLQDINAPLRTNRLLHLVLTPVLHTYALRAPNRDGRSILRLAAARGDASLLQQLLVIGRGSGKTPPQALQLSTQP